MRVFDNKIREHAATNMNQVPLYGAVTYHRIRETDAKRTEKMQKLLIRCSSSGENCLSGDEGLCGTCKERIKRMSNAYVTDKERSTNGLCRMSNGCITHKTHMYRIRNGKNVR